MNKTKKSYVHIKILQNGFPIAETIQSLSQKKKLSLSGKDKGELALPLYPLFEDIELLRIHKDKVFLHLDQPWSGFVTSGSHLLEIKPKERSERIIRMQSGNYASIVLFDLRVMIKITTLPQEKYIPLDPKYSGKIKDLLFTSRQEFLASFIAVFTSLVSFSVMYICADRFAKTPPQAFEELSEPYTLPFISPDSISTAPEALHENINRTRLISSTVKYYRQLVMLIMGWSLDYKPFLFASSRDLFSKLYGEQSATIEKSVLRQRKIDQSVKKSEEFKILSVPAVYGENIQTRIQRIIDTVEHIHQSFALSLEQRRIATRLFNEDPDYDWSQYLKSKDHEVASKQLAQINVFNQKTNEELMYLEAKKMAAHARIMQETTLAHSKLFAKNKTPLRKESVYILGADPHVSFLNSEHFISNLELLAKIPCKPFSAEQGEHMKEPLVGRIEPGLIQRTIRKNKYQINLCYELALRRNYKIKGEMKWQWRVDSSGKISDINLIGTSIQDQKLLNCVREKVASWTFPKPENGSIRVNHSFAFNPILGD